MFIKDGLGYFTFALLVFAFISMIAQNSKSTLMMIIILCSIDSCNVDAQTAP